MSDKEQKYDVEIGFKTTEGLVAILCQEGVDKLFVDVAKGEKFIVFYCCDADKTLLRTDEIVFLFSKKIGVRKVK